MATNLELFRDLTRQYIQALQQQELARLDALPADPAAAVDAWVAATNIADEINGRRLQAREDLLAEMQART